MSDSTGTLAFTYYANGMRTKKVKTNTSGTVTDTYNYVYNGSQLTQMTKNGQVLNFFYDGEGRPAYFTYGSATYYYVTNLQGDVIAILDSNGTMVVNYHYDAYGVLLHIGGAMATSLGTLNPLTYRGYVYDHETGLYYLQSRYYNPTIRQFISPDAFVSTGQGYLGYNMFAYCLNNPVNMVDVTGAFPKFLIEFIESCTEWVETAIGTLLYITETTAKGELMEYWVDSNAKVHWSRHHTNHGNSKTHPVVPHDHEWYDDDDGNNTEDPKWQHPNPGFKAPKSKDDNSAKIVAGAISTAAIGYVIYTGAKWFIAAIAAPATGGGSLIVAGVTP